MKSITAEEMYDNILREVYDEQVSLRLDERQQRLLAAKLARAFGHGGIVKVAEVSGITRQAVARGITELEVDDHPALEKGRIRQPGGGRKKLIEQYPNLLDCLERILDGSTYGDPGRILFHTSISTYKAEKLLKEQYGISVSRYTIATLMGQLGYSRQVNQKTLQVGKAHPDRNQQFEFINDTSKDFIAAGDPVISMDCKKKENVGNFKNLGSEYRRKKDPRHVLDHDFPLAELGKVAPYGIYTLNDNTGFVNLGTSKDTSEFAVQSLRRWWMHIGKGSFPQAKRIYITCDGGGSNASRSRQWKYELARFSEDTGLEIHVSHFPPGTSKWNKVEHRLFCYITKNWQGKPLIDIATIVDLIGSTTTKTGLRVMCEVDTTTYETGTKISDEVFDKIDLLSSETCSSWNYVIKGFKC